MTQTCLGTIWEASPPSELSTAITAKQVSRVGDHRDLLLASTGFGVGAMTSIATDSPGWFLLCARSEGDVAGAETPVQQRKRVSSRRRRQVQTQLFHAFCSHTRRGCKSA
jgi:hypothetical protein